MRTINIILILFIMLSVPSVASASVWFDKEANYRIEGTTMSRYGTVSLNISNACGTNTATLIYACGQANFSFLNNFTVQTNLRIRQNAGNRTIWFKNISNNNQLAQIYFNTSTTGAPVIYLYNTNYTFNNSLSCTHGGIFRFCNDFEGSSIAGNWTASGGTMTQSGNGYLKFTSATGNLEYARSSYSPDATGSWAVLADIAAENTVDGYGFVGQTGTGSFGSLNSPQINFGNIQGNAVMNLYNYNAAGTTTPFTTSAAFWDRPTNVSVEVRKTPGTAQAYLYTQGGSFVERQTSTTNLPSSTNGLGLYEANSLPLILNWFAVSDYNTSDSAFTSWSQLQSLWWNTKTNDQSLNFSIPNGFGNITFYLNTSLPVSWSINGVSQTSTGDSLSRVISVNSTVVGSSTDASTTPVSKTWTVNITGIPELIYPLNGTVIVSTFPPISTDINFSWYDTAASNIQVASDANFNILLLSATTSNQNYIYSLQAGTYYWRVRHFNTSTSAYGDFTNYESFMITASTASLPAGANLQGVVYETINGIIYPIEGAIITITNSSLYNSNETRTASNGYYLVTGLSNFTTYSFDISKTGYDTPARFYFTTNNTTVIHNVELQRCTSSFNCYFDSQFVRFQVQNMFGRVYSGVTISAYIDGSSTTTITGDTDSTGSVDLLLSKQTMYRITFISTLNSINVTWNLYPKEDFYLLVVNGVDNFEECANKNISIYATDRNSTHERLNLNYSDPSATTTLINFTVYYANNRTVYATQGLVGTSTWDTFIDVPMGNSTAGVEYIYGYNSTIGACGVIGSYKAIVFPPLGGKLINIGISDGWLQTISIMLLVTIGAMFGARNVTQGAISVSLFGMFFTIIGWFRVANFPTWTASANAALSWTILVTCLVISLILHMRKREVSNI